MTSGSAAAVAGRTAPTETAFHTPGHVYDRRPDRFKSNDRPGPGHQRKRHRPSNSERDDEDGHSGLRRRDFRR